MKSLLTTTVAAKHHLADLTLRNYLKGMGIRTHRLRDPARGNQLCAAITEAEEEAARQNGSNRSRRCLGGQDGDDRPGSPLHDVRARVPGKDRTG